MGPERQGTLGIGGLCRRRGNLRQERARSDLEIACWQRRGRARTRPHGPRMRSCSNRAGVRDALNRRKFVTGDAQNETDSRKSGPTHSTAQGPGGAGGPG